MKPFRGKYLGPSDPRRDGSDDRSRSIIILHRERVLPGPPLPIKIMALWHGGPRDRNPLVWAMAGASKIEHPIGPPRPTSPISSREWSPGGIARYESSAYVALQYRRKVGHLLHCIQILPNICTLLRSTSCWPIHRKSRTALMIQVGQYIYAIARSSGSIDVQIKKTGPSNNPDHSQ